MKTVDLIAYKREDISKAETKRLRNEGFVPCVVYGGETISHVYVPQILFRELVYTSEAHFVNLDIEGSEVRVILQDVQYHPVSETILHADFLELHAGVPVRMDIPVHLEGQAPGVSKGGTLVHKRRKLSVKALPKNMPEFIEVDISGLDFHKSIKVEEIEANDFEILDTPQASIAVVEIPRALKTADEVEEGEGEELEEGAEAAEGAETPEGGAAEETPAAGE